MNARKDWVSIGVAALLTAAIHVFSYNSANVEHYYSRNVYPYISIILRKINAFVPFSIGDVVYGIFCLGILIGLIKFFYRLGKNGIEREELIQLLLRTLKFVLWIYVFFNLLWGLNYNRKGITYQLGITLEKYNKDELIALNRSLLQKVNESKMASLKDTFAGQEQMFATAARSYAAIANEWPYLYHENVGSVKSSLWGKVGNYTGFLGYYNPFTGEAQINTTIPVFIQKYTVCHEMAHQLGYAKENEANFVGYLAASNAADTSFRYSVYLDLFFYSNKNLYQYDSVTARSIAAELIPEVKQDILVWREFMKKHKNPVEPIIRWMYDKYLQQNEQPAGMLTYDEVSAFLIAYQKKYGRI